MYLLIHYAKIIKSSPKVNIMV